MQTLHKVEAIQCLSAPKTTANARYQKEKIAKKPQKTAKNGKESC